MTNFFLGIASGATIASIYWLAVCAKLKLQRANAQFRAALERQNTLDQVDNCLQLMDSVEAQLDREHYRKNIVLPDWQALVDGYVEGGRK